jgi:hypothetical protein
MIAYDPVTYHQWRQEDSMAKQIDSHSKVMQRTRAGLKRRLKKILPPSRASFSNQMKALARQIEAQDRMLEQLERRVAQLIQAEAQSQAIERLESRVTQLADTMDTAAN